MKKLLRKLNIDEELIEIENGYEYEFYDYDVFTDVYNTLENYTNITKNSPQSYLNEDSCHVEFDGDDYFVYLEGDFNSDEYTLTITEG